MSVQLSGIVNKGAITVIDPRAGELAYKQSMLFSKEYIEQQAYKDTRMKAMLGWQSYLVETVAFFAHESGTKESADKLIQQLQLIIKASCNMEKSVRDFANSEAGTKLWKCSPFVKDEFRPMGVLNACKDLEKSIRKMDAVTKKLQLLKTS